MKFIPKIERTKIILVADGTAATFTKLSMGKICTERWGAWGREDWNDSATKNTTKFQVPIS